MKFEPIMTTHSGRKVNPADMQPHEIDINDIAHHLAMVNRFGGAADVPISVAQHSVYVYRVVAADDSLPLSVRVQALLHDASEAYLGDIIKWLKQSDIFAGYRKVEAVLERRIWGKFGCQLTEMHPAVLEADKLMVRIEAFNCMPAMHTPGGYGPVTKDEMDRVGLWTPWRWDRAKTEFLNACLEVGIR